MQCIAAGHQIVALANLRPAENQGKYMPLLGSCLNEWNSNFIITLYRYTVQRWKKNEPINIKHPLDASFHLELSIKCFHLLTF